MKFPHYDKWTIYYQQPLIAGNMFTKQEPDGTLTQFTYDPENRLTKVVKAGTTIAEYTYDGDGGRTSKKVSGITTTFVGSLYEETLTKGTKSIFLGSTRIASVVNGKVLYYHADHLGGANVITDDIGTLKELTEYKPFGEFSRQEKYGTPEETARFYFTNQYRDDETGLYFYGARYYDPSLGRFITADPTVQNPGNPVTLNRYQYAGNNPVNNIDPSGYGFFRKLFKIFNKVFLPFIPDKYKGVVIGAALTLAGMPYLGAVLSSAYNTALNGGSFGSFARGVGIGLVSGAVGSAVGGLVPGSGSFLGGLAAAGTSGAVAGGLSSVILGGSFGAGAGQGAIFAAAGYLAVKGANAVANKIKASKASDTQETSSDQTEQTQATMEVNQTSDPIAKVNGAEKIVAEANNSSQVVAKMSDSVGFKISVTVGKSGRSFGLVAQGAGEFVGGLALTVVSFGTLPVGGIVSYAGGVAGLFYTGKGLSDILTGFGGGQSFSSQYRQVVDQFGIYGQVVDKVFVPIGAGNGI